MRVVNHAEQDAVVPPPYRLGLDCPWATESQFEFAATRARRSRADLQATVAHLDRVYSPIPFSVLAFGAKENAHA
jgi:hypothetical protein